MNDDAPEFVLFCTIDGYEWPFVIGMTNDEINAVVMFNHHVDANGDDHIPHIHMERRRAEWGYLAPRSETFDKVTLDAADNLFRVPPAMVQRMAEALS